MHVQCIFFLIILKSFRTTAVQRAYPNKHTLILKMSILLKVFSRLSSLLPICHLQVLSSDTSTWGDTTTKVHFPTSPHLSFIMVKTHSLFFYYLSFLSQLVSFTSPLSWPPISLHSVPGSQLCIKSASSIIHLLSFQTPLFFYQLLLLAGLPPALCKTIITAL